MIPNALVLHYSIILLECKIDLKNNKRKRIEKYIDVFYNKNKIREIYQKEDTPMKSEQQNFSYKSKIQVFYQSPSFGPGVAALLMLVERFGSINAACSKMNMAYSKAWKILKTAEKDLGFSLLRRTTGGKGGGSSELTPEGRELLYHYIDFSQEIDTSISQAFFRHFHSYMKEDSFLSRKLQLPENSRIISLIGGGGKTSSMYRLAQEYAALGKKVLLTTTTHILVPPPKAVPILLYYPVSSEQLSDAFTRSPIVALGSKDTPGKLSKIPVSFFPKALEIADIILCEADGARMLPIKVPASHEPAIVPDSDAIIILTGLSCLYQPLKAVCHRKDLAARLLSCTPSTKLTPSDVAALISHPDGLMKGLSSQPDKVHVFLNQADTKELRASGEIIKQLLLQKGLPQVLVGSLHMDFPSLQPTNRSYPENICEP